MLAANWENNYYTPLKYSVVLDARNKMQQAEQVFICMPFFFSYTRRRMQVIALIFTRVNFGGKMFMLRSKTAWATRS